MIKKSNIHILVIRLSAMGDVAMVVPVLRALTAQHPTVHITVLTKPLFKPFFRGLANVNVVVADVKGKHKGVFGLYKLGRLLSNSNTFYGIADLHNVLRSKVLKRFIKCKRVVSIDKGRKEKMQLTNGKIFKPLTPTHQRYADVFSSLGYTVDLSCPTFSKPSILKKKLKHIIGPPQAGYVGIAPFAAHEGKVYPISLMKEVVLALSQNFKILLFGGGQAEINVLNKWAKLHENIKTIAGTISLDEELDIISNLDVMLSMDSGNAHVAAMLGIKVVTIWGVTHPFAGFAPFNQPQEYALVSNRKEYPLIPTSIYGNKYPESYKNVAKSIAPKRIVAKINTILKVN